MKTPARFAITMILLGLTLTLASVSYGDDRMGTQIQRKFARGVANTFTGWVEMPKQVYLKTVGGPLILGTVQGVVEGVGMSFVRTTAGLYEMATFPIPVPWYYEPLLEPAYVWQQDPASGSAGAGLGRGGIGGAAAPYGPPQMDDGQDP